MCEFVTKGNSERRGRLQQSVKLVVAMSGDYTESTDIVKAVCSRGGFFLNENNSNVRFQNSV